MRTFIKDPNAQIDFSINWGDGYLSSGEQIATSIFTISPVSTGSTQTLSKVIESHSSTTSTVVVKGGIHNNQYLVKNNIMTTFNKTDERYFIVKTWEPV